jgi:YD repeat-containing protein
VKGSAFWHPPAWKWVVVFVLFLCVAFLVFRKPWQVHVELLPFEDSPPEWNGSYPYLSISMDTAPGNAKFNSSILLIKPSADHPSPTNEAQVDLHSGRFVLRQTDLFVPDIIPLSLTRTYSVWSSAIDAFGVGTNHPYDICPSGTRLPYTYMDLNLEDGRQIHFSRISNGTGYADAVYRHNETASEFYGAQIAWNGNGWTLTFRDGRRFLCPEAYNAKSFAQGAPVEMQDAEGRRAQLIRDKQRNLEKLISPGGRTIAFKYDEANRIVEATDDAGNLRRYSYDSTGHLQSIADRAQLLFQFRYAPLLHTEGYDPYLMTAVTDGKGATLLENSYQNGRISDQKIANGAVYHYQYILAGEDIAETIVDGPNGKRKFYFRQGIFTEEK